MQNSSNATLAHNLIFSHHTKSVLKTFRQNNIPVMVLKGIALAELVYPNIGMRDIADIDLLIKEKDAPAAYRSLQALGYELHSGTSMPTFVKEGEVDIVVQLHTGIPCFSDREIWSDELYFTIDGEEARTLSLERNLAYLCYHLAVSHMNSEQKWVEDIHRFIGRYGKELDWHALINTIMKHRLSAPCYYTFLEVRRKFNTEVPDTFLSAIRPKNNFQSAIFRDIFEGRRSMDHVSYVLPLLIDPALALPYLFPSVRTLRLRYNVKGPAAYLYYAVRPAYLISRGTRAIAELLFKKTRLNNGEPA